MNTHRTLKRLFFALLPLVMVMSECTKKNDVAPVVVETKTTLQLISGNTYKLTVYEGSTEAATATPATWKALGLPNETLILNSNGNFSDKQTLSNGNVVGQEGTAATGSGWKLSADGKTLTYGSMDYIVLDATATTLTTRNVMTSSGYNHFKWTWTKQ